MHHGQTGNGLYISGPAIFTLYNVCSVHRAVFSASGDTMSTSGGYHEHIGECSVHQGDVMSISGDIMSTSGGYHDACGGASW